MQKQIKFIYAVLIVVIIGGGFSWWVVKQNKGQAVAVQDLKQNIEKKDIDIKIKEKDDLGRSILQIRYNDPDCNNENFENVYYGELKKDMPVQVILSCDQERFNIVGSVSQIIDSKNKDDMPQGDSFNSLADISSGSQVVDIADDYNFDGYNDLSSVSSNGSEAGSYNIFLYEPAQKKFVFNIELSAIQNLSINEKEKTIIEDFSYYNEANKYVEDYKVYKWANGHLVKVK